MPFAHRLRELLTPLVEFEPVSLHESQSDFTCRLFHSTVRDFILRHPSILALEGSSVPKNSGRSAVTGYRISEEFIADACLSYLQLPRYKDLLQWDVELSQWLASTGEAINQDSFLLYAVRFWEKHYDQVKRADRPRDCKRIISFLKSPNFVTCLQVQSLWMDYKFQVWPAWYFTNTQHVFLLPQSLPRWFPRSTPEASLLWHQYRLFLYEWRHVLTNSSHTDQVHTDAPAGHIDRCWWGSLDPESFLLNTKSRYHTFRIQDSETSNRRAERFEGINTDGSLKVLWLE
jgi:hypothetical protein